jgi:S1-C subfamily serine protease
MTDDAELNEDPSGPEGGAPANPMSEMTDQIDQIDQTDQTDQTDDFAGDVAPTAAVPSRMPPPVPPPVDWRATSPATPVWPLPPVGENPAAAPPPGATAPTDPTAPTAPTSPIDPTDPGIPSPITPGPTTATTPIPPFVPPLAQGMQPKASGPGNRRSWIGIAVVAALIGGGVGAGVTALADNGNGNNKTVTIHEGNADPGAAVLSGNVTIPQLVKKVIPAVVSIDVKSHGNEDEGTGMIITSSGEVVTNNHVIELFNNEGGTGTITVTEYGQKKADPATLVGYNQQEDVALLKINNPSSNLPTVTFCSSSKAVVGDAVVAIGNALGLAAGTPTVTQGIVSALGRSVSAGGDGTATENLQNLIQTDAAINPGNSGGPLIDTSGQVIGMNTAVAGTSDGGTNAQNIGFAIPAAEVESLLPQLQKGGPATNGGGYLGVDITTLTSALRQQYGFTPTSGVVVLNVISGSPGAKAGLTQGDVIVDIDGNAVSTAEDLQNVIQKDKAGQKIQITYYVGDNKRTLTVTLGTQAQAQQQESQAQGQSTSPFGAGGFTSPSTTTP